MNFRNTDKIIRTAAIGAIIYLFCFALAMALFPIRPFWNDEWRLMYNIKFKTVSQLWGVLDLLQECPRTYLTGLKLIGSAFDYSYISFRLPPLLIGLASVFLLFRLQRMLYPGRPVFSYLFILILVSSQTFTDYLVQVKQYEMDIFLCLLALWQLDRLLAIAKGAPVTRVCYILLCFSMLMAPYFSYTYPITIAPVFPVLLLCLITGPAEVRGGGRLARLSLPLSLVTVSIILFYFADVRNMLGDKRMYLSYLKVYHEGRGANFAEEFWKLFSLVGSGLLYEIIFGILGLCAFGYAMYRLGRNRLTGLDTGGYFRLYAVLLLLVVVGLFLSGKLIGGVARLTAYTVPSIAILIIFLLDQLRKMPRFKKAANITAGILFLGLFLNIITTCIGSFTYPEYRQRITTFWRTSDALREARLASIPIMVSGEVHGDEMPVHAPAPGRISTHTINAEQIAGADDLASEVIVKVNPEYKVWDTVVYFYMPDDIWVNEYVRQLPPQYPSVVVGDGLRFRRVNRQDPGDSQVP